MRNRLTTYQRDVKKSKAKQFLLRWGRRTGKNYLVDELTNKGDILIYPTYPMASAAHLGDIDFHGYLENGAIVTSEGVPANQTLKQINPNRVFIMEPALFKNLYQVIGAVIEAKPKKVYVVGSPTPSGDALSSSFLFNAITREANLLTRSDVFFSLVGASDAPHNDEDMVQHWREMGGGKFITELDAKFKDEYDH